MEHYGSGYSGYSMSNNAVEAYDRGEMPLSKWSKTEILNALGNAYDQETVEEAKKLNASELRDMFLTKTGYHHTGKFYNSTNFYIFDDYRDKNETLEEIRSSVQYNKRMKELAKKTPKVKPKKEIKYAHVGYTEWEGTRKHPKPVYKTGVAKYEKNGDKVSLVRIYRDPSMTWIATQKRLSSLHVMKEFDRKPNKRMNIWKRLIS